MEILIPGHRNDSPSVRVEPTRKAFGYIPAWRVDTIAGDHFFICGKCFSKRGTGPLTSQVEYWTASGPPIDAGLAYAPLVPDNAICADCGSRAWPAD